MLKNFFKILKSFFPRYDVLMEMGYRARTFNNDFILSKNLDDFSINIHQSVEPFNYRFGKLIDFEIEEACVIIEIKKKSSHYGKQLDEVRELFDYTYEREKFIFCMFKHMSLEHKGIPHAVREIEKILTNH